MLKAEPGDGVQPLQSAIQAAKAAASVQWGESDLVLIDVGLLFDARFPVASLILGVELSIPPQGPPLFLLLDDMRLVPKQVADHLGEVGFVRLGHKDKVRVRTKLYAPCQADEDCI
jgi:hypothetical protein